MEPIKTRNESKYLTTRFKTKFMQITISAEKSVKQIVIDILALLNNKFPERIVPYRPDNAPELSKQKYIYCLGIEVKKYQLELRNLTDEEHTYGIIQTNIKLFRKAMYFISI